MLNAGVALPSRDARHAFPSSTPAARSLEWRPCQLVLCLLKKIPVMKKNPAPAVPARKIRVAHDGLRTHSFIASDRTGTRILLAH
jgi:hypothetical protein